MHDTMESISLFLDRFSNIQPPNQAVIRSVVSAIKDILSVEIEESCISVRGNTVHLQVHPVLKSELHIHRDAVTKKISQALGRSFFKTLH
jgi:hypothetical protein